MYDLKLTYLIIGVLKQTVSMQTFCSGSIFCFMTIRYTISVKEQSWLGYNDHIEGLRGRFPLQRHQFFLLVIFFNHKSSIK